MRRRHRSPATPQRRTFQLTAMELLSPIRHHMPSEPLTRLRRPKPHGLQEPMHLLPAMSPNRRLLFPIPRVRLAKLLAGLLDRERSPRRRIPRPRGPAFQQRRQRISQFGGGGRRPPVGLEPWDGCPPWTEGQRAGTAAAAVADAAKRRAFGDSDEGTNRGSWWGAFAGVGACDAAVANWNHWRLSGFRLVLGAVFRAFFRIPKLFFGNCV